MKLIFVPIFILFIIFALLILELLIAIYAFEAPEPFENPSRSPREFGTTGEKKIFLVMGDSTSAGQGADYEQGIAVLTAQKLAEKNKITLINTSISGARLTNILDDQIKILEKVKPDIVLLSVGANDVTHFTANSSIQNDLNKIIKILKKNNCHAKIILTGSPDMGASKRLLPPLSWVVGLRSTMINNIFYKTIQKENLTFAPIAEKTGPLFKKDRSLFYIDSFHPNEIGYATWIPILNTALNDAINHQPSHCNEKLMF